MNQNKERSRPQVARYRLMNDDEEFEASPNEYSSDEEEENQANRASRDQSEPQGSNFGRANVNSNATSKWGGSISASRFDKPKGINRGHFLSNLETCFVRQVSLDTVYNTVELAQN